MLLASGIRPDDANHAPGDPTVAPMREKEIDVAERAVGKNLGVADAAPDQLSAQRLLDISKGLAGGRRAWLAVILDEPARVAEDTHKLAHDFRTDLKVLGGDAGSDCGADLRGAECLHFLNGRGGNARDHAPPAGVHGGNDAPVVGCEQYRAAIGDTDGDSTSRVVGHDGVGPDGTPIDPVAAGVRPRTRDNQDLGAVYLVHLDDPAPGATDAFEHTLEVRLDAGLRIAIDAGRQFGWVAEVER